MLRDVSFRVEPGQTLAIVGHTGAGKTTIIQLLLRFYEIQRGDILLDGVDIREMNLQDLRRIFGIVLQDPFLFTGTLESNVKLGSENIDRATWKCAARGRARPLPRLAAAGMDTPVTERGGTLSVGQRQLVSFARALAHNPKFLILDEATSSVDTKTELLIRDALDRLLLGRTADGDRASAQHYSARASHSCVPQGPLARTGLASGACWRCAGFTTACTSFSTKSRNLASRARRARIRAASPPMTDARRCAAND